MSPTAKSEIDAQICGTVWTSRGAQQLMELLSYDIGPRPCGSKEMREASQAVQQVLSSFGASNVHAEPVPVFGWNHAPSRVELVSPRHRVYDSVQHVHSASGQITGPLVEAGVDDRIAGAIVLLRGHEASGGRFVPIQIRVRDLCRLGAAGLLVRNLIAGTGPAIELMGVESDIPIPALGVSWEDTGELAASARSGNATIRLEASGASVRTHCVNTIAELGPGSDNVEMIILSAHMDTFHVNPGSFDNLTGVVTLLEMARALAPLQQSFVRRLRLIVYTGEEYGFLGSRAYIAAHSQELDRICFVFNLDSLWPATADAIAVMGSPEMRDYITKAFAGTARSVDVRNMFCMSSDYLPFLLEGIACARPAGFEAAFPPYSHTKMDTPDKAPPDWIRLNAMSHAQLLARLLTDPEPLPARRKSASEVQALLDKENARELIRVYGFPV
jgi:hypothetical protein